MTERMTIAIEAMKALLQKDYKNVAFSAYNTGHKDASSYIAEQAFVLADSMIEREKKLYAQEKNEATCNQPIDGDLTADNAIDHFFKKKDKHDK